MTSRSDDLEALANGEITLLLANAKRGDEAAIQRFIASVYADLRKAAHHLLRQESANLTLETTDIVHEAYLRLFGSDPDWQNRRHFFGSAARAMRRILIDHARAKQTAKRNPDAIAEQRLVQQSIVKPFEIDMLALDRALAQLEQVNERQAQIVELKFFAGLSDEETADVLNISRTTVYRQWQVAKLRIKRLMAE
ncbi:MAG: ECF-type sigma factor [Pseudomonadota bacterium]